MTPTYKGMEVLYENGCVYYGIINGEVITERHGKLFLLITSKTIKKTYQNQVMTIVLAISPNGVKSYNE
jgi:hypothetical protein